MHTKRSRSWAQRGHKCQKNQRAAVKCDKRNLDMIEHLSRAATTSKGAVSKRQKHQATIEHKDSKFVSLAKTSKSNDAAKGETNDGTSNKKTDDGVKAIPLDPPEPAKTVKVGVNLDPK